jgi:hypothetical protein
MKSQFLLCLSFLIALSTFAQKKNIRTGPPQDDPAARFKDEAEKTADPSTGKIPFDELEKARGLMGKYFSTMSQIPGIDWKERGPSNIGGRTRALMFDPNDATNKKVWAGGVAGGLWYNNDITDANSSWQKISDFWDNLAISCIAYDPSNPLVMYVGTGEGYFNGDAVSGGGIWKTLDGGLTWKRLSTTVPNTSASSGLPFAFQTVQKIVVSSTGRVFAATRGGVVQSNDNGATWAVSGGGLPSPGYYSNFASDLEIGTDDVVYAAYGLFSYTTSKVFKTNNATNDGTSWATITPAGLTGGRTEIALAASTNGATQLLYMINQGSGSNFVGATKRSADGGTTWTDITKATGGGTSTDITNGQAWYDLILAVHPTNPDLIFMGGATHARSKNAQSPIGTNVTWTAANYGSPVHPDNHACVFRPSNPNQMIMGNDGGIYYSTNFGDSTVAPTYSARNKDYNVTQFYGIGIKNVSNDGYVIAGAQDNGTMKITSAYNTIGTATALIGGDGMIPFIDQDNPAYQFGTYQYNNYRLLNANGGYLADLTPHADGKFVNPADYDSPNNTLYSLEGIYTAAPTPSGTETDIARYVISGTNTYTYNYLSMNGNFDVSFIRAGTTPNTVFVGTTNGFVYKLTGITGVDGDIPTRTTILTATQGQNANVSCIEIGATEDELLVTYSNYSVKSVFYTSNGGTTWTSKDNSTYGLPNIPVRYAIFNPLNRLQVLIATELGVWTTSNITAANPEWAPTNANLAHVKCNMLKFRASDNTVAVATHGRGVFTTQLNQVIPCQTVMTLVAPYDNKSSGTNTYSKTETISATNKITGTANVTYKASKSIELKPINTTDGSGGFEVGNGAVFNAYITGCNN